MGLAYLPDGTSMDYDEYIRHHPHWQKVRKARFDFDRRQCVICHKNVEDGRYETHHLNYDHLGNEHLTDVITLCLPCHTKFHNYWQKQKFWKGREPGHWDVFSLEDTAKMCAKYYKEDRLICKDITAPNLCNRDIARKYIDQYYRDFEIEKPVPMDPNDFNLFVRNKRYELYFQASEQGMEMEEFLDSYYGPKIRGKNPIRQEAGKKGGVFDHTYKELNRHYKENQNLTRLMKEARKYYTED